MDIVVHADKKYMGRLSHHTTAAICYSTEICVRHVVTVSLLLQSASGSGADWALQFHKREFRELQDI